MHHWVNSFSYVRNSFLVYLYFRPFVFFFFFPAWSIISKLFLIFIFDVSLTKLRMIFIKASSFYLPSSFGFFRLSLFLRGEKLRFKNYSRSYGGINRIRTKVKCRFLKSASSGSFVSWLDSWAFSILAHKF